MKVPPFSKVYLLSFDLLSLKDPINNLENNVLAYSR